MQRIYLHEKESKKGHMSDNCDIRKLNRERLTESVTSSG